VEVSEDDEDARQPFCRNPASSRFRGGSDSPSQEVSISAIAALQSPHARHSLVAPRLFYSSSSSATAASSLYFASTAACCTPPAMQTLAIAALAEALRQLRDALRSNAFSANP
jgi:hypothetical protein